MKKELKTRHDVHLLVQTFYSKVRKDEHIGFLFNEMIEDWDAHIERLTDFWETNLFFKKNYKGNPVKVHAEVDAHFDNKLAQEHFGYWINHWFQTVDELYEGDMAQIAKNRARNMAFHIFMKIYAQRKS